MIEKHLHRLNVNPFFGGMIFQAFYKGYEKGKCPLILNYLVLPLTMHLDTRDVLLTINSQTNLRTLINSNKTAFINLQTRIWNLRRLTNLSLLYLHNKKIISLKTDIEIYKNLNHRQYKNEVILKSSHYTGVLFKNEDLLDIFKILKVIP